MFQDELSAVLGNLYRVSRLIVLSAFVAFAGKCGKNDQKKECYLNIEVVFMLFVFLLFYIYSRHLIHILNPADIVNGLL